VVDRLAFTGAVPDPRVGEALVLEASHVRARVLDSRGLAVHVGLGGLQRPESDDLHVMADESWEFPAVRSL
jgi:hypothetical protein